MIDTELRHRLSQDLRSLVTGRMTNDDFDDVYHELYMDSEDPAVREIARFGWALYSSDLVTYKLRGRHRVSDSTRRTAAYAVLFLQTEYEYGYPEVSHSLEDHFLGGASYGGSMVGIAFILIGVLGLVGWDLELAGYCFLLGISIVGVSALLAYAQHRQQVLFYDECDQIGDLKIWPFVDSQSLAEANGNNYLLSNFQPEIAT